jgi:hypothetical protein
VYRVDTELYNTSGRRIKLVGSLNSSLGKACLRAGAAIRSVFRVRFELQAEDVLFDGNFLADYAVSTEQNSFGRFENCGFSQGLLDAFYGDNDPDVGVLAINDKSVFVNCAFGGSGRFFYNPSWTRPDGNVHDLPLATLETVTGLTASISTGSSTVTATNANFVTRRLRKGDLIIIGSGVDCQYYIVASVDSESQVTIHGTSTVTVSNVACAFGRGWGFNEARHGDNNIHTFISCLSRSSCAGGIAMNGLYGHHLIDCQIDYNQGFEVAIGNTSSGGDAIIDAVVEHCYFEGTGNPTNRKKHIWLLGAKDCLISFNVDGVDESDPDIALERPVPGLGRIVYENASWSKSYPVDGYGMGIQASNARARYLDNGFIKGVLKCDGAGAVTDGTTTFPLTEYLNFATVGSNIEMLGSPKFTDRTGQAGHLAWFINTQPFNITINNGGGVILKGGTVVLGQYEGVLLRSAFSGGWFELARTSGASGTGPAGADGADGVDGADGASAYEIAVANGFVGDEAAWLASLVGADGADGADGDPGIASIGTFSNTPTANGISLSSGVLTAHAAGAATPGMLNGTTQIIGGGKTFSDRLVAESGISVGSGAPTARHFELYKSESFFGLLNITNGASDGYSSIYFNNTAGTYQGSFGFANGGTPTPYTSKMFVDMGVNFIFVAGGAKALEIDASTRSVETAAGRQIAVASVSSNTTLSAAHHDVSVDASGGAVTITLPSASAHTGRIYTIRKTDSSGNAVSVASGDNINGLSSIPITTQYGTLNVVSNGSTWFTR